LSEIQIFSNWCLDRALFGHASTCRFLAFAFAFQGMLRRARLVRHSYVRRHSQDLRLAVRHQFGSAWRRILDRHRGDCTTRCGLVGSFFPCLPWLKREHRRSNEFSLEHSDGGTHSYSVSYAFCYKTEPHGPHSSISTSQHSWRYTWSRLWNQPAQQESRNPRWSSTLLLRRRSRSRLLVFLLRSVSARIQYSALRHFLDSIRRPRRIACGRIRGSRFSRTQPLRGSLNCSTPNLCRRSRCGSS